MEEDHITLIKYQVDQVVANVAVAVAEEEEQGEDVDTKTEL